MFDVLKKIKNKIIGLFNTLFFHYKNSQGFLDFSEKCCRYLKANGLHLHPLISTVFPQKNSDALFTLFSKNAESVDALFFRRFSNLIPFQTVCVPSPLRINIVTDSLAKNSLYGGVATSIIFAILLANKLACPLRVITRTHQSNASVLLKIAELNGIQPPLEYEMHHFPYAFSNHATSRLMVSENDIFIGTSWWSCMTVREVSIRKKYIYILQEDEKIFYPNGDEHVMIDSIFSDPNMIPIVNTQFLYQHLIENNYEHIRKSGMCFEPAFKERKFKEDTKKDDSERKFNLFFYARPHISRNLFYTGVSIINTAIDLGILKTNEWTIYFAGQNSPDFVFTDGTKPKSLGQLDWAEYLKFIHTVDLGVSLMIAPTPSYPPLDIVAAGGVVLTNAYKNKISFENYSKNIICSDLDKSSLLKNIELAVNLAKNSVQREKNFNANRINYSWENSFSEILDQLQAYFNV